MPSPNRFVIVGTPRTGTTLIRTSLSSHPQVLCHGEVFKLGRRPYALPGGYWEFSRRSVRSRVRAALLPRRSVAEYLERMFAESAHPMVGFKLMLSQCNSRPYIWPLLTSHPIKAVMVTRRNVLKTLVSRRTAAATGVYHVSESLQIDHAVTSHVARRIRIGTDSLLKELNAIAGEPAEWHERLGRIATWMEIAYEEYVQDIARSNREILGFLGVAQRDLHSDLEKVNPDRLTDVIGNYDEVAKTLKGTLYAYCLDDP